MYGYINSPKFLGSFLCCLIYGISVGISGDLLPIHLSEERFASIMPSSIMKFEYIGNIVAIPFISVLLPRLGLFMMLLVSLALYFVFLICFWVGEQKLLLQFIMLGIGISGSTIFVSIQYWVNNSSHYKKRATNIGILTAFFTVGTAIAHPIIYALYPIINTNLLCAIMPFLLILCFLFFGTTFPQVREERAINMSGIILHCKIPIVWGILSDYMAFSLTQFVSVYGIDIGVGTYKATTIYMIICSAIFNIPMGLMIDRFNKPMTVAILIAISMICFPLMPSMTWSKGYTIALCAVLSAAASGIYIASVAILGDKFQGDSLSAANSILLAVNSIGSFGGTIATGAFAEAFSEYSFVISLTAICVVSLIVTLYYILATQRDCT